MGIYCISLVCYEMDVPDITLRNNHDWDPSYLNQLFQEDFLKLNELWDNNMNVPDSQLVEHVENIERYCPVVEDISVEDELLCTAVKKIEQE